MILLLQEGNRECPYCDYGEGCQVCDDTGELGNHSNRNFDLRPYMKPEAFRRWIAKKFPTECTYLSSEGIIRL